MQSPLSSSSSSILRAWAPVLDIHYSQLVFQFLPCFDLLIVLLLQSFPLFCGVLSLIIYTVLICFGGRLEGADTISHFLDFPLEFGVLLEHRGVTEV
jgi:hypothetical protein